MPGRMSNDVYSLPGTFAEIAINRPSELLIQKEDELQKLGRDVSAFLPCYEVGIRSFPTVLLVVQGQVIGALHLSSKMLNAYTDRYVGLAESVGAQIAGAIANAQLYEELNRTEEILQEARDKLEERVKERTAKLSRTNILLNIVIAERKRMEETLLKAAAKIEEQASELTVTNARLTKANKAKSEFLAHVSHELQTPLNAALGFDRLLEKPEFGHLTTRQQHFVGNILAATSNCSS